MTKTIMMKIGNISEECLVKDYDSLEIFVWNFLSNCKLLS